MTNRHRRLDATMARLERHCVWEGMASDELGMTRLCLYCAETKAAVLVLRALERTPHGRSCAFRFSLYGGERGGYRS